MQDNKMGLRGPWPGPKGMIPEPEQNAADANTTTRRYLDSILVEERIIDAVEADLHMELFGKTYDSPIMMPAFSHLNKVGVEGHTPMEEYAEAARRMNLVNWVGMEPDEDYRKIAAVGADTVRIIKPFADHERIFDEIRTAKETGAIAVGVDIDHVFGTNGAYDIVDGIPMGTVTEQDLAEYAEFAGIPFIAKGVLSRSDAMKCKRAGLAGIVISHHHGRMPFALPPLMVLPEIRREVGEEMKIFVDCNINDGYDAFKALALGADAVSVGRGILAPLLKEGTEGVVRKVTRMNEELSELMGYAGIGNMKQMDPTVLRF